MKRKIFLLVCLVTLIICGIYIYKDFRNSSTVMPAAEDVKQTSPNLKEGSLKGDNPPAASIITDKEVAIPTSIKKNQRFFNYAELTIYNKRIFKIKGRIL